MPLQNPVVVIPGITATSLVDEYPLEANIVWSMVFNKEYERVALHPDDLRFEAIEPARVTAGRVFPIYEDLIKALRHELSPQADQPTPVFAFPYDWRMDVRLTAARLTAFVEEVLGRTRLLRHYGNADGLAVDLVGHSMGGLVICEYLAQAGRRAKVGKVVTIGTPWLGSVEAIVKIATGMTLLTGSEPKERERETARILPAIYQLFPSWPGAVVDAEGRDVDVFDPANMQASVIDSLTEFVRLYAVGVRAAERRNEALRILGDMLSWARAHRATVTGFRTSGSPPRQVDWLVIAGLGQRTRLSLTVDRARGGPRFVLDDAQFVDEYTPDTPGSRRTGDGTVPLPAALPPFLPESNVVCVGEDDLNFFELRDRLLVDIGGMHGLLPRINLVQRLVTKHLQPRYRGEVWGRRVPGVARWTPPIAGLPEKSP
ncbi:MAG TPA: hypothetical protein VF200_15085 [Woeseiaceae bacterium]